LDIDEPSEFLKDSHLEDEPCYVTAYDPDVDDDTVEFYVQAELAKWYSSEAEGVATSMPKDEEWLVIRLQSVYNARTKSKAIKAAWGHQTRVRQPHNRRN